MKFTNEQLIKEVQDILNPINEKIKAMEERSADLTKEQEDWIGNFAKQIILLQDSVLVLRDAMDRLLKILEKK